MDGWTGGQVGEMSNTRGHSLTVRERKFNGDVRGRFFIQRMVRALSTLLGVMVDADTLVLFKGLLDMHVEVQGI